ncbi:MAG TPA: hypothetical protein VFJ84_00350 [Candidatus Saccharimonadales bacterium]|nr:hypothetical protein [Candidatus Saccharimonadales bacterium]
MEDSSEGRPPQEQPDIYELLLGRHLSEEEVDAMNNVLHVADLDEALAKLAPLGERYNVNRTEVIGQKIAVIMGEGSILILQESLRDE